MQNPRKIYCIDNGLFNNSGLKFKKNYGKLYENIVFLELKRKTFLDHSCKLHYWKSQKQEEVDFVLKEGTEIKQLIQVCYELENPETKKRELKSLIKASKELKCHNLIVINKDVESEEIIGKNKIVFIPLRKWLLNEQRSVYK